MNEDGLEKVKQFMKDKNVNSKGDRYHHTKFEDDRDFHSARNYQAQKDEIKQLGTKQARNNKLALADRAPETAREREEQEALNRYALKNVDRIEE